MGPVQLPSLHLLSRFTFILIPLFAACNLLARLCRIRLRFHKMATDGLPMPPHSLLFGHLHICARVFRSLPHDAHSYYLANELRHIYPDLDSTFYLDIWPFGPPVLMVGDKELIRQFTQDDYLPKHEGILSFLKPLTGGLDLVTIEGEHWKRWRRIFNPVFSAASITAKTPLVMEEVNAFKEILRQHAGKGDIFQLEQHTIDLTMDVVGHFVLGTCIGNQNERSVIRTVLRDQLPLTSFGIDANPFKHLNPITPFRRTWNAQKMRDWLRPYIDDRKMRPRSASNPRTIIDQAWTAHLADRKAVSTSSTDDRVFEEMLTNQLRLMLFSGHDTTSSTLCYTYHVLSQYPSALQTLRAEHDAVFGSNLSTVESQILGNPALLEDLPYTTAVINETLRLYPVVVANRAGQPDFHLHDQTGRSYPTEDCLVIGIHHALHRNPAYWPQPDAFLPERWLVPPTHPLAPMKDAWRPFEAGWRGCIGRQLAMKELKMVLVMTVREFEVKGAMEEWDCLVGRKGLRSVRGEECFQAWIGTASPRDGLPCRVRLVQRRA